jgi:hypothetical protein
MFQNNILFFVCFEKEIARIDIRGYICVSEFFSDFFQFFHVDFFVSADIDASEESDVFHGIMILCDQEIQVLSLYFLQKKYQNCLGAKNSDCFHLTLLYSWTLNSFAPKNPFLNS